MRKPLGLALVAAALLLTSACSSSSDNAGRTTATTATSSSKGSGDTTKTSEGGTDGSATTVVDDLKTPADWAASFCRNFSDWRDALVEGNTTASGIMAPGDNAAAKGALVTLFGDAATQTEDLIATLQSGGSPDIEQGDALVGDLVDRFQGFSDAATVAQDDAKALDATSATFEQDASALSTRYQEEVTKVGQSFAEIDTKYPSKDLSAALTKECGG